MVTTTAVLSLLAALAVAGATIALALVWPQGLGARSPGPFGHMPVQQRPEVQEAMRLETEASQKRLNDARDAVRAAQSQAIAPGQ